MIYQHRFVISRGGRMDQRHETFQGDSMKVIEAHGSILVGSWEVWVGPDAGSAVYQLRQFESLAAWEQHQDRIRADAAHDTRRLSELYSLVDYVDTSIVRLSAASPALPVSWPSYDDIRGTPRGVIEHRTIWMRPDMADTHHETYFRDIAPALDYEGAQLIGLFDTLIGPGTTNGRSHCSIELRRFPDLASWQRWRERQDTDPALRKLNRQVWPALVDRIDSRLMTPLDFSRIR